MTRRPVNEVHSRANSAMVWLLPAPAGAISTVVAVVAVSIVTTASRCSAFRSVRSAAVRACSWLTELRHRPFRGGEDLLFGVQVGQRAVAFLVRRPVDAAAVRGADAEAGHVGDIRGGDLDDLGPGPARDGQLGHLGDHRLAVGAGGQHRERPVHLEPELWPSTRPRGAFAPRRPRSARRCAWPHRPAPPVHVRCAPRRTGRPARAPPTGRALRDARSGLPRRRAAAPRSARSRRSARPGCGGPGPWCGGCSARPAGAAATASAGTAACRARPRTRARAVRVRR